MINETIICPHCGAEISSGQTTCEACGQSTGSSGGSQELIAGIGAILGGIFAVTAQFLIILMFCPGVCDSPGVVSIFWPLVGVNFILGVVVGYMITRLGNYRLIYLVGAAIGSFLVALLSSFALFILVP